MELSWLLAPVTQQVFVDEYWAQKPLRIRRTAPAYYQTLLPEQELELTLYTASRVRGAVELLSEDNRPIPCQSHAHALEGFKQGKSLRIDGIHRFSHGVTQLARRLEEATSCPVNVNMYLTPGLGKKALGRHYDTHDVFVLQIHGEKHWRLYDQPFPFPLEFLPLQRYESYREMKENRLGRDASSKDTCTINDEFDMEAGDCLYLPRGFWHEAESAPGGISCHLTVGIQPTTYLDVLSVALAQIASSDVRLRKPLPFGFASDSATAEVSKRITEISKDISSQLDACAALAKVAAHNLRGHATGFQNSLLRRADSHIVDSLVVGTRIARIKGVRCSLDESTDGPIQLVCGTGIFNVPPKYVQACKYICQGEDFSVDDLPGDLTLAERIALIRQFIVEGVFAIPPVETDSMGPADGAEWLPVHFDRRAGRIKWLDFAMHHLTEPFFQQSVDRLKKESPTVRTRVTPLKSLHHPSEAKDPAGFIFHISRCGSTLLSNGLRAIAGTNVIVEAQPIGEAAAWLSHSRHDLRNKPLAAETRDDVFRQLVLAYGRRPLDRERALIIKFSSWNILHFASIQRVWPHVPSVVVIRDPIEVAVSCLESPTGWMNWLKHADVAESVLEIPADSLGTMSRVTFCSTVLGKFLKAAASAANGSNCRIVDHCNLNRAAVLSVADHFGIGISEDSLVHIDQALLTYSKDPKGQRVFVQDQALKQVKATKQLRTEIGLWARPTYEELTQKGSTSEGTVAGMVRGSPQRADASPF